MLIPALPSKLAVPTTSPLSAIALGVARVAALPLALPVNAPINVADVNDPVLGLYVSPLSCLTAVNAPLVELAKYNKKSVFVLVSPLIVAPAAAKLKLPLASVTNACPEVPSALG